MGGCAETRTFCPNSPSIVVGVIESWTFPTIPSPLVSRSTLDATGPTATTLKRAAVGVGLGVGAGDGDGAGVGEEDPVSVSPPQPTRKPASDMAAAAHSNVFLNALAPEIPAPPIART